jgi:BRCT domain type II-containing protein
MQKAIRNRGDASSSIMVDYERYTTKPQKPEAEQKPVKPSSTDKNFCPITQESDENEEITRLHAEYIQLQTRLQQIHQRLYQLRGISR